MRLIYYYILITSLLGYTSIAPLPIFELSKDTIKKLDQNEIVTIKTDLGKENNKSAIFNTEFYEGYIANPIDGEHYQIYGVINANINEVYHAIENFDNYSKFMTRLEQVEYINPIEYIFHITLPMDIRYQYRIKIKKTNPIWLAWDTVPWKENSIKETFGQWHLEPYKGSANKTLVRYQIYTDPGYIPFGVEWIVDIMTRVSLPKTVKNLKTWIENNEN